MCMLERDKWRDCVHRKIDLLQVCGSDMRHTRNHKVNHKPTLGTIGILDVRSNLCYVTWLYMGIRLFGDPNIGYVVHIMLVVNLGIARLIWSSWSFSRLHYVVHCLM